MAGSLREREIGGETSWPEPIVPLELEMGRQSVLWGTKMGARGCIAWSYCAGVKGSSCLWGFVSEACRVSARQGETRHLKIGTPREV